MIKNFALTLIFTLFVSNSLYAACSKKEIVQFVELGFTKEEIKQICEDDSIDFGKDQSQANEAEEADEKTRDNKEPVKERNDEIESIPTTPEVSQETLQQARQSTKQGRSQIVFEIGGMNGEFTLTSNDEVLREYSGQLDHQLSGGIFSVTYQYKFDSNLIVGLGYQYFKLEGESETVRRSFVSNGTFLSNVGLKIKTNEFKGSGLVGLIGYEFNISKSVDISPQLRIGISNEISATQTAYSSVSGINTSSRGDEVSENITPIGIAIPLVYRFGAFGLGVSIYSLKASLGEEVDSSESKAETTAGAMIFLGNKF
jgi:DNA-binding transcriptional MerR regulator